MNSIHYQPIGIIHSPHTDPHGMPIQPSGARGIAGHIVLDESYVDGLADLEGFSHIILLYHFHRVRGFTLKVVPFLDSIARGVLATRAPRRPNAIGLSVVRLVRIEKNVLFIEDVDILDNTPLLDIKPYVPEFDPCTEAVCGWLERTAPCAQRVRADTRFDRPKDGGAADDER